MAAIRPVQESEMTEKPLPWSWGPNWQEELDSCGEYPDDGDRAIFPHDDKGLGEKKEKDDY